MERTLIALANKLLIKGFPRNSYIKIINSKYLNIICSQITYRKILFKECLCNKDNSAHFYITTLFNKPLPIYSRFLIKVGNYYIYKSHA